MPEAHRGLKKKTNSNIRVKSSANNSVKSVARSIRFYSRRLVKKKTLQREACKICSAERGGNSGTTIYLNSYSELDNVTNPKATWASNQASKDVSSRLGGCVGLLEDRERWCCPPCVLWGSLESSSLLLGAAGARL